MQEFSHMKDHLVHDEDAHPKIAVVILACKRNKDSEADAGYINFKQLFVRNTIALYGNLKHLFNLKFAK